jgi:hypothetical protein
LCTTRSSAGPGTAARAGAVGGLWRLLVLLRPRRPHPGGDGARGARGGPPRRRPRGAGRGPRGPGAPPGGAPSPRGDDDRLLAAAGSSAMRPVAQRTVRSAGRRPQGRA